MKQDLDAIKSDIEQQLEQMDVAVFRGRGRGDEAMPLAIFWDELTYPDPKLFLDTARRLEVKVVVFHHRIFTESMVDEAFERLESSDVERDDRREYERNLRRLKAYVGFTAAIELSYDYDGNTFLYEVTAPWFDDLLRVLDEIDDSDPGPFGSPEDDDGGPPLGGYFSQN
ncbi:MAG: hypothetical protein R2762_17430 [Bryobacteraceae bacterium]